MGKIVSFGDHDYVGPNKNVVAILEEFLKLAKEGNVRSIVILGMTSDGAIRKVTQIESGTNSLTVLGGLQYMAMDYYSEYLDSRE